MSVSRSGARRAKRSAAFVALCLTAGALAFVVSPQVAMAGLANQTDFNATDKSPTGDIANGAVAISDPFGNDDVSTFSGSDELDMCPAIGTGLAANKDDLDKLYLGTEANDDGVFLYLGWHRIAVQGTTTVDYEINQAKNAAPNCNGISRARTEGDLLITFDFHGTGPFTPDVSFYEWVGNSTVGTWVGPNLLTLPNFEASVSDDGAFGEVVIDLVAMGLLGTDGCNSFSTVLAKTRSSSENLDNTIKDWVIPQTPTISNCGSVSIHKQDDAGTALSGVVFDLYTNVANAPGVAVTPAQNCTTNASGNCTISDVFPGTYWLVERAAPANHTGAAAQKVVVDVGGNTPAGTLTFVNNRKPARVDITKEDDAGALLQGAGFTLYTDDNGVIGDAVAGKSCTTNSSGVCSITNILPPGTYWLRETTVPDGHTGADDYRFELSLDETHPVTFVNDRKPARVDILKKDDAGTALAGAGFTLYTDVSNAAGEAVAGKTCTTGLDGKCSITNILPPGTYWVVETTTPAGHDTADDQKAELSLDETLELTFENVRQPARIDITKEDDAGALLQGAGFTLYTDDNGEIGDVVQGKTCTTNSSGVCSITNILPTGFYWVSETTVPDGHTAAADRRVELTLNDTEQITFVNPRKPARVDILKTDDTGAVLAGASFALFTDVNNGAGAAVEGKSCTTGVDGTCSITNILPPGTYWVVETVTPPGHDTAANQKAELSLDETLELEFENVRQPISIALDKKVDGEDSTEGDPLLVESGDTVTYTITVTNTGDQALTITALADSLQADLADSCTQGIGSSLAAGASFTCTYDTEITDEANNEASVTGTDVLGRTTSADDEVFVTPIDPHINLVKTGPTGAHVGDVVTYTLTVTNTGDTGLSDVDVTDDTCDTDPALKSKADGNQDDVLDVGEKWTFTCTYTVVEADGDAVDNTAVAAGTDVLGKTVTWTDTHTFPVLHPAISIVKTASPESISGTADVTFTYVVTNTGDTALFDIAVTDDILGAIGTIAELDPGESATLTRTVSMGPGSPTTNVGTATGADVLGKKVSDSDPASISIVLGEVFVRPVELPRTGAGVESQVQWAGLLIGAGLMLVTVTRIHRRRPTPTA